MDADGQLLPAADEAGPDVVVRIPLSAALALAAGDERSRSQIQMSGDPAFAAVLGGVLRELRWDVEEDLSRVVGDIAAHRIVRGGPRPCSIGSARPRTTCPRPSRSS